MMKISLNSTRVVTIELSALILHGVQPVLNGRPLHALHANSAFHDETVLMLQYTGKELHGATFTVEIHASSREQPGWLRYSIEHLDPDVPLDSFGLRFAAIENLRAFLRNGYHSWDGSAYVEVEALHAFAPDEPRPETGYAMTQLLPRWGSGNVILGFDRHDRFQQTFTLGSRQCPPALTILTWWDQKDRSGLERCASERLIILEHAGTEEALREWARLVAQTAPQSPRVAGPPINGWSSWYNLYTNITEDIILDHLRGTADICRRNQLPMRFFQIDDGFTPEMGDWLEVKPQFPRGLRPLLDDIRAAGFVPGLWIAPFMVGNRSRLYHDHPNWILRDRVTGRPIVQWAHYGEYRWHKRSEEYYILDTTHPDAFEYLRQVFRIWRTDWGSEYFKTDFMHYGSEYGPDRAIYHTPGLTRMEIWRRVAEMIRTEIGDATWLGSGCPLWASVGLVDGVRVSNDVGVQWQGELSAQSLLRDLAGRNFANHILWQIDPDSILLREQFHALTEAEICALAIYAGMSGGVMITGDDLKTLSPERLRLWKLILSAQQRSCQFPFSGQTALVYERSRGGGSNNQHEMRAIDPVLVQVRRPNASERGEAAVFIFNTGEYTVQRTYPIVAVGLHGPLHVFDWTANSMWPDPVDHLSVTLAPHHGALLFLARQPIYDAPEHLP